MPAFAELFSNSSEREKVYPVPAQQGGLPRFSRRSCADDFPVSTFTWGIQMRKLTDRSKRQR